MNLPPFEYTYPMWFLLGIFIGALKDYYDHRG